MSSSSSSSSSEFEFRVRDGDHHGSLSTALTREEQTVAAMSVLGNKLLNYGLASHTPRRRVWLAGLPGYCRGTAVSEEVKR